MQEPSLGPTTGISANLHQILDLILDKGLVVDLAPRLSLGGIEVLSIGLRVVIGSADTFLQHAEQINRIGQPHRPDGTGASKPTPKRGPTKKRDCRKLSKVPAALPRRRLRQTKTRGADRLLQRGAVALS